MLFVSKSLKMDNPGILIFGENCLEMSIFGVSTVLEPKIWKNFENFGELMS